MPFSNQPNWRSIDFSDLLKKKKKKTSFWFHWFSLFIILFLVFALGLITSSFSCFIRWKFRSLICDLNSSFLIKALNVINFLPSTTLSAPHKFWYAVLNFHWIQRIYLFSCDSFLIHQLFKNTLFTFQIPGNFLGI